MEETAVSVEFCCRRCGTQGLRKWVPPRAVPALNKVELHCPRCDDLVLTRVRVSKVQARRLAV